MRKYILPALLLMVLLACALPGASPSIGPLPTFDPNSLGTAVAETAAAAQTQTALNLPTATNTASPTRTPTITPTFTPTFIFALPTFTPLPTFTSVVTVSAQDLANIGGSDDEEDGGDGVQVKNRDRDPRKMSGKEWTCVGLGTYPPQGTTFKTLTKFTVSWSLFNSGTMEWQYNSVDLVYAGGYRHEETRIQDFARSVPSGGEIKVYATFITPKNPGEFQTFFHLMVGKRTFCKMIYTFKVVS